MCLQSNNKQLFTVPTKSIRNLSKSLKQKKIIKKVLNNAKIRIGREVLVDIGWIVLVDYDYDHETGVAQKWKLGENHPRYALQNNMLLSQPRNASKTHQIEPQQEIMPLYDSFIKGEVVGDPRGLWGIRISA